MRDQLRGLQVSLSTVTSETEDKEGLLFLGRGDVCYTNVAVVLGVLTKVNTGDVEWL